MCMNAFPEEEIGCHIPVDKINGAWDASEWVYGTPSEHLMRRLRLKKLLVHLSSGLWPLQKQRHIFFCCCCVLAQDLSIWRTIMNWLLLWTYKQLWQSTLRPLKALCAHSTIKKTAFDGSEGHLLWKEAASYYCVWFYCNLHFRMQNWIEPHNLDNFNLIGWYTAFSVRQETKLCLQATGLIKWSAFVEELFVYCHQTFKRRCFIWDTKHIFQNCTTKK